MTHIVYIAHARFPTEKAHGKQIVKVCEALGKMSELTLLVPGTSSLDPFDFYGVARTFAVEKIDVGVFPRASLLGFLGEKIAFLFLAAKRARMLKPDHVVTREPGLGYFYKGAVVELHDLPRHIGWYRFSLNESRKVIVKTHAMKGGLMQAHITAPIIVLPNAIDLTEFAKVPSQAIARSTLNLPGDAQIALYSGSLYGWKGVDIFAQASGLMNDVLVVLVGGSQKEIEAMRLRYPHTNIRWVGHVGAREVPLWLAAADVLVLPNTKGSMLSERYTSPLKLFEYMAARRPIVASRLPSIQEVVDEGDVAFANPSDPEDLARVIKNMLADKHTAAAKAVAAYEKVRVNTWDEYVHRMID